MRSYVSYKVEHIPISYHPKYVQNKKRPKGTPPHWEGTPAGSSWTKDTCWLCAKGCAVLSYLYWKNLEPDQRTVEDCLDKNADFVWSRKGLHMSNQIVAPSIGKVSGRSHYVYIICPVNDNVPVDGEFNIFDPDGSSDIIYQKPASYFDYCWKE